MHALNKLERARHREMKSANKFVSFIGFFRSRLHVCVAFGWQFPCSESRSRVMNVQCSNVDFVFHSPVFAVCCYAANMKTQWSSVNCFCHKIFTEQFFSCNWLICYSILSVWTSVLPLFKIFNCIVSHCLLYKFFSKGSINNNDEKYYSVNWKKMLKKLDEINWTIFAWTTTIWIWIPFFSTQIPIDSHFDLMNLEYK